MCFCFQFEDARAILSPRLRTRPESPFEPFMKDRIFRILQPSEGYWPSRVFDIGIMTLILVSVFSVFAETFSLPTQATRALGIIEVITSLVFTAEYALRLWTSDKLRPDLPHWRARILFVLSGMAIIDLVAILPFWLPTVLPGHLLGLRAIRLVRLLRILKLNRYMEAIAAIGDVFRKKSRELVASCIFIFLLMLLSSLLIYHAEHGEQPEQFRNAFSGLWWAVATLTTVGYGDIYPITALGRFLGAVIAILGIGMVAIPTGILSSGFVEHFSHDRQTSPLPARCPHCGKLLTDCATPSTPSPAPHAPQS